MKRERLFRLPEGKITNNSKRYFRAWERLARPICKLTGAELIGYDPDIQIRFENIMVQGYQSKVMVLSPAFLQKLNEELKKIK